MLHQLGAAFAAGVTRPGAMHVSLTEHGHVSQTYDTAGRTARIGRWSSPTLDALKSRG